MEKKTMSYREGPSKEELHKMLSEANREREASNKRLLELEQSLRDRGISITPPNKEKKPKVTVIDVGDMAPKEALKTVRKVSSLGSPTLVPEPTDDSDNVYFAMLAGVTLSIIFCLSLFFLI